VIFSFLKLDRGLTPLLIELSFVAPAFNIYKYFSSLNLRPPSAHEIWFIRGGSEHFKCVCPDMIIKKKGGPQKTYTKNTANAYCIRKQFFTVQCNSLTLGQISWQIIIIFSCCFSQILHNSTVNNFFARCTRFLCF